MHRFWSVQTTPVPVERVVQLQRWLAEPEAAQLQKLIICKALKDIHEAKSKDMPEEQLDQIAERYDQILDLLTAYRTGVDGEESVVYEEATLMPRQPT